MSLSSAKTITAMLAAAQGNAIGVWKHLEQKAHVPATAVETFAHVSLTPSVFEATLVASTHSSDEASLTVKVVGTGASKAKAKQDAYRHLLCELRARVGDNVSQWGRVAVCAHHDQHNRDQVAPLLSPSTPTTAQLRSLAFATTDMATLKQLARDVQTGQGPLVVALCVKKNESGPEVLEIGLTTVDTVSRSAHTLHFIVDWPGQPVRPRSTSPSSWDFASLRRQVRCGLDAFQPVVNAVLASVRARPGSVVVGHSLRERDVLWLRRAGLSLEDLALLDLAGVEMAAHQRPVPAELAQMATVLYPDLAARSPAPNAGNAAVIAACIVARQMARYASLDTSWMEVACAGTAVDTETGSQHSSTGASYTSPLPSLASSPCSSSLPSPVLEGMNADVAWPCESIDGKEGQALLELQGATIALLAPL